jgi:membrane carboxypeptidase/penicillin-binding protein
MSIRKDWNIIKIRLPFEIEQIEENFICGDKLIDFLIQAEDHRYRIHCGFDIIAICRALYKRLICRTREGASTIEQQLVRVLTYHYEYSFTRKLKEIILATMLKSIASKKEIALVYLNIAYYGTDFQNLDAILLKYGLNKNSRITDKTCAEIVARLKYPEPHSIKGKRLSQIKIRTQYILNRYYSKH